MPRRPLLPCLLILVSLACGSWAQPSWKIEHRLQAGGEADNNIFETATNTIGTIASRLFYTGRLRHQSASILLGASYAGGLQLYAGYPTEHKTIHEATASLLYRLNGWIDFSVHLRGAVKLFFDAPLDFAQTTSSAGLGLHLPAALYTRLLLTSGRADFADSDHFDTENRGLTLLLRRAFASRFVLETTLFYTRLEYVRPALELAIEQGSPVLRPLPFPQRDTQRGGLFRLGFGRRYLARFTLEYLDNDANSYGFSYRQWRISILLGLRLGRLWTARFAAMRQFKSYREDIAPILQRALDPESDENNFAVADLSYDYTARLTYLLRLSFYKNEAVQRGRFYRKTQLFIGAEYRF